MTACASLDGWTERSAVKTHFVLIDYSGGQYVIQARQYDGLTGQPSPVVRRDQTRDREFVAKLAALLVEQDFGMAGVFDRWPAANNDTPNEDQPVTLRPQGRRPRRAAGPLGPPRATCSPSCKCRRATAAPASRSSAPSCRSRRRRATAPPTAFAASSAAMTPRATAGGGYRCVKLGTVEKTPVRLRLFQALPDNRVGILKDSVKVEIRHKGFQGEDAGTISKQTGDADDAVDTAGDKDGLFDHAAFVSVLGTDRGLKARIPIPLLDDQPVVLAINVADDPNSLLAFRRADWKRDVDAAWREQAELFREITDLAAKPGKTAETIKLIQEGVDRSHADHKRLLKDYDELAKAGPFDADDAKDRLKKIDEGAGELGKFLEKVQKIDAEENDPKKKQWRTQVEEAKRLESQLDIDKALAIYDQVLREGYQDEELKKYAEQLHKEWDTKNDALLKARVFVYDAWPTLDNAGLKDKLAEAQDRR